MLVDANLLIYAVDESSPFHERANTWLTAALNGSRRVGIPWVSLVAFLRITTNARATDHPLTAVEAAGVVGEWMARDVVWAPAPGPGHTAILLDLIERGQSSGNLIADAHLAAIAIEHGLVVMSNDSDFTRFDGLRWENPLSAA